jgi:Putative transposase
VLRPAVAQYRLRLSEDGRVVLELKATWSDGTSHLVFDPLDLLARLAALVPRPRVNLILYHGVLAPHARFRGAVVSYGAVPVVEPPPAATVATATDAASVSGTASLPTRRNWTWAQLMQRAFDVNVLVCRACGCRLRFIATILDPATIRAILRSMGLATEAADRAPPSPYAG